MKEHQSKLRARAEPNVEQVLCECFRHFAHLDEANAAIHCSPVRYSPLTFRLGETLKALPEARENLTDGDSLLFSRVISHVGAYPEDVGRVEMDPPS